MTPYAAFPVFSSSAVIDHFNEPPPIDEAWHSIAFLRDMYPDFRTWYWAKVVPGLIQGERRMFVERDGDYLSGIVIAKRAEECKLCTIWTHPAVRGRGVATRLIRDSLDWLGTDRPLVTVPDKALASFSGLFKVIGFEHRHAVAHLYGLGRTEHVFNGVWQPDLTS